MPFENVPAPFRQHYKPDQSFLSAIERFRLRQQGLNIEQGGLPIGGLFGGKNPPPTGAGQGVGAGPGYQDAGTGTLFKDPLTMADQSVAFTPSGTSIPGGAGAAGRDYSWLSKLLAGAGLLTSATGGSGSVNVNNPMDSPIGRQIQAAIEQLLASEGRTDPRRFNRMRVGALREGESLAQLARERLAESNMQNFLPGVINEIQTQAQGSRLAEIDANEAALAEARRRDDLLLALQTVIGPELDLVALLTGQANFDRARRDDRRAATAQALLKLAEIFR